MENFKKLVVIDDYTLVITFFAKKSSLGWSITQVSVKNNQTNKIVYRSVNPFNGTTQLSLKGVFKKIAITVKDHLLSNREIDKEIEELEEWDGVVNF
ncbi:hypothetical protein [Bacillus pumilus]|uniref:Uncharacterized protein n=1 Tax=Bacillus pumilus TaxID=1408 RepID=A0AAD0HN27_BACPU|nr:hypothetical protein [Bacillus pumilus]AVM24230.1 hypothetical protein C5695_10415 [Bacillus pumilus]TYS42859.1 hypothetical protein FZC68_10665 [Bacillus pumilus]